MSVCTAGLIRSAMSEKFAELRRTHARAKHVQQVCRVYTPFFGGASSVNCSVRLDLRASFESRKTLKRRTSLSMMTASSLPKKELPPERPPSIRSNGNDETTSTSSWPDRM